MTWMLVIVMLMGGTVHQIPFATQALCNTAAAEILEIAHNRRFLAAHCLYTGP